MMDIEEIKEQLGNFTDITHPTSDVPIRIGLIWIIEKLQETPAVQVAHLEPGDVVLVRARYPLPEHERESLLTHFSRAFPTNGVIVTDDVEEVLAVRPERPPCVCEHDDGCPRLREHDEQLMANVKDDRPRQGEHIDADGEFQSDKYPWCAAGFVPLKLSDPKAMGPLWAYARARAFVDTQFSNDLALCLARTGYVAAMEAVRMANGEPMREAF